MSEASSKASLIRRIRVDAHAAWLCARDRETPWYARTFALILAAYALSPIDLVPDFIPVLGLLDDIILIPLGLWLLRRMLPTGMVEAHRASAAGAADRPKSLWGAAFIVLAWILIALVSARLLAFYFD